MIEFQDFGIEDNARYLEYVKRCIQIPSDSSPINLLGNEHKYDVKRGYAENLCWHKFTFEDTEFWGVPAGDWDEINWREVFAKHVPEETVFYFVPEYLVNLWQKQLGAAIEIEDDRNDWDYILSLDRMKSLEGKKLKSFRMARNAFEKITTTPSKRLRRKFLTSLKLFKRRLRKIFKPASKTSTSPKTITQCFCSHWSIGTS